MTKTLWLICLVLGFALVGLIVFNSNLPARIKSKKILGNKTKIPSVPASPLVKPPQMKPEAPEPNILAKSVILIDRDSFKIIYQKNPTERVPIASTTKIMTALVILENYPDKLKDEVQITREMINVDGSDIDLRPGEKMTVENLLKGLLIYSGNDAAFSLASFFGGKEEFVKIMNEKAIFLGLKNTRFRDPAGLDDEGFSTARDLAILASYALRNKTFAEIARTPNITLTSADGRLIHELKNSNRMLRSEEEFYYPFAIGIKTGFTPAAGHCLVSAASKDNHVLIAVILNTNENTLTASAKESRKLLEWGFANFSW